MNTSLHYKIKQDMNKKEMKNKVQVKIFIYNI